MLRLLTATLKAGPAIALALLLALSGCQTPDTARQRPTGAAVSTNAPAYDLRQPNTLPARLAVPLAKRGPYLLAPARLNGQAAGLFLLDTGSALDAVEIGLANRMGLPRGREGTAIGIGGRTQYHQRRVQRWQLNGVAMPSDTLAGLELRPLNEVAPFNANGVVGYRALKGVPFTLDSREGELILHNPRDFQPPDDAAPNRLLHYKYLPTIKATLSNDKRVLLIIDSGADNAITLPRSVLKRWPEVAAVPETGGGQSRGIGGSVRSTRTWLKSLSLFGLTLQDVPVAFESSGPGMQEADLPVGRVGLELLQHFRLTFEARESTLWVQWRPGQREK